MQSYFDQINVCICTYKRPQLLKRLLEGLINQDTTSEFAFSVIIVDNDNEESAREIVSAFIPIAPFEISYHVEAIKNIARARNHTLRFAKGDYIAFIDDDEVPNPNWLHSLLSLCKQRDVDGVLGPVRPYFEHIPPSWISNGNFFGRPEHHTGYQLSWWETRTGNVLFRRCILAGESEPFRLQFGTGNEDMDFFKRMSEKGKVFIWCNEAPVYELISPERCGRMYQIKKGILNGGNSIRVQERFQDRLLVLSKAIVGFLAYAVAMPLLIVWGDYLFMKYLIKLCHHLGMILGICGFQPIKERSI